MTIRVNDTVISEAAIHAEVQYHPAASPADAHRQAARALVVRELLLQRADQLGIDPALEGERRIAMVMAREVQVPQADAAACQRYYEHNRQRFRTPDQYDVAHILIPRDPAEPAMPASDRARQRAEALIAEIVDDPGRFTAAARRHSACPSRDTDGRLGVLGKDQTVPEFEAALEKLREGEIGRHPVETRYGFHIIRMLRHLPGEPLPLSQVLARIREILAQQARRRAVAQYLSLLVDTADIQGIELQGADSPLVQ